MKNLNSLFLAAFAASSVQFAGAMNYQPTDVLLVFRDGNQDVEFDLGPVSQFTGLPAGTQVTVSYNQSLVNSSFGTINGVDFLLVAASSPASGPGDCRVWATDVDLFSAVSTPNYFTLSPVRSLVDAVGADATAATAGNTAPYVVSKGNSSAYDYLVTGGSGLSVPNMNGSSPFTGGAGPVEIANPTTLAFYQMNANNAGTPATLLGAFTIDVDGRLYFTAGRLPPLYPTTISQFTPLGGGTYSMSFTTTKGNNYELLYTPSLSSGIWTPVAGGTAVGDNTVQSFFDFSTNSARLYRIKTTY